MCAAVAPPEGSRPLCGCRGGGRWWVGCSCPAAPAAPRPGPPPRVPPAPGRAAARPVGGPPGRCPLAAWPLARPLAALPPPGWPSSLLASRPQASCLLAVSGPLRAWVRAGARVPPSRRFCSVVGSGLAAAPPPPGGRRARRGRALLGRVAPPGGVDVGASNLDKGPLQSVNVCCIISLLHRTERWCKPPIVERRAHALYLW